MPNKAIDAQIFCPFYITESKLSITCEGIIGAQTVSRFTNEPDKISHEESFCTDRTCAGCGVYSSLMKNYPTPRIRH